jgi:hypothetical protein
MTVHQVGSKEHRKPLRVLPRGTALVPDYEALYHPTHSVRRFHGWTHDRTLGEPVKSLDVHGAPTIDGAMSGGFRRSESEVVEVPDTAEYRRHLRGDPRVDVWNGDLWPADLETAREVGCKFYPLEPDFAEEFADEHPAHATALKPAVPMAVPTKPDSPKALYTPEHE